MYFLWTRHKVCRLAYVRLLRLRRSPPFPPHHNHKVCIPSILFYKERPFYLLVISMVEHSRHILSCTRSEIESYRRVVNVLRQYPLQPQQTR